MAFPLSIEGRFTISRAPSQEGRRELVLQAIAEFLSAKSVGGIEVGCEEINFWDRKRKPRHHPLVGLDRCKVTVVENEDGWCIVQYELGTSDAIKEMSFILLLLPCLALFAPWPSKLYGPVYYVLAWLIVGGLNHVILDSRFSHWLLVGLRDQLKRSGAVLSQGMLGTLPSTKA